VPGVIVNAEDTNSVNQQILHRHMLSIRHCPILSESNSGGNRQDMLKQANGSSLEFPNYHNFIPCHMMSLLPGTKPTE